jgi:hypothetical protein
MRKITIRLATALLAFVIGIAAASLFLLKRSRRVEELPVPNRIIPASLAKSKIPEDWRKINIGDVSFRLPPHLKNTGLPGNAGVVEAFEGEVSRGKHLYLYYAYGNRVPSDDNPFSVQNTEMLIDGKRAKINIWEYDKEELLSDPKLRPGMILFMPDVGAGKNKFEIYAVSFDPDIIKQIFGSVEIR